MNLYDVNKQIFAQLPKINEKEIRNKVKEYEENKMAMDKVLGK